MNTDMPANSQLRTNEAELIKSVCNGKREAFYELLQPYERMVYATAMSVVKNPADAEECRTGSSPKAFANLGSFRAESKFSTWMLQITYNEAKMKLRKARSPPVRVPGRTNSKLMKETITQGTLRIGGPSLANYWKKARCGKRYKTLSLRSALVIAKC